MKIKSGKIERIPEKYSEELYKVIQSMLSLDKDQRPSVEELMIHPNICFRLRDRRIKEMQTNIKRKEVDITTKE